MATTKVRLELIYKVLDNLGVLVSGQAPSDEMVAKVDLILDPVFDMLSAEDIVYVQDPGTSGPPTGGAIENAIFLPLADCVAWRVAGAFSLVGDPALKVLNDQAEETLIRLGRPAKTRKTLRTDIQLRSGNRRYAVFNFTTGR